MGKGTPCAPAEVNTPGRAHREWSMGGITGNGPGMGHRVWRHCVSCIFIFYHQTGKYPMTVKSCDKNTVEIGHRESGISGKRSPGNGALENGHWTGERAPEKKTGNGHQKSRGKGTRKGVTGKGDIGEGVPERGAEGRGHD